MVTKDAVYHLEFNTMNDNSEDKVAEIISKIDSFNRNKVIREALDTKFRLK